MSLYTQEDTDFVKFWNTILEPKFTKYRHILQGGLSRHSAAVLPIRPGMAVLDVGYGWGDMSMQVAEMVGPEGRVVGVDCVDAFLAAARADAAEKWVQNIEFRRGDAEVALPEAEFDYVVARFGTMFFLNPSPSAPLDANGAEARRISHPYRLAPPRGQSGLADRQRHHAAPSAASGR